MEANSSQKGEEREAQTEKSRPTNVTQKSGAGLTVKSPKTLRKENRLFLHGRTPCAPTGVSHVPRAYYTFNPAGETKTSNFSFHGDRLLEGRDWAGLHPQTSLTPTLAQALCWAQGCRNNETLPCPQGHSKLKQLAHTSCSPPGPAHTPAQPLRPGKKGQAKNVCSGAKTDVNHIFPQSCNATYHLLW